MDRNTKIVLGLMATAIVYQGHSLRKLAHINNTNVDVYRRTIDTVNQLMTDMQFADIVQNYEE